ncbi:hypothetical protein L7F22_011966 [Adiantum nelumboides]|nr:hypothetical protein [Adiantum nelumboides]
MGMLWCFGRLVKKEQNSRIASTGIVEVSFDIVQNPIFKATQNSVLGAMQRGGLELYRLERWMFLHRHDELGVFDRFCERSSKDYKVDLMHFQPKNFRPAMTICDDDLVATFDQLMHHMPRIVEEDKNLLYLFLQPINSPCTQVWYNRNRVSVKLLSNIVKCIGERTGVGGSFSNKILRSTCVTQMSLGQVPREVGGLRGGNFVKKPAIEIARKDASSSLDNFVGEGAKKCNGSDGGGLVVDSVSKATSSGCAAVAVFASNGCGSIDRRSNVTAGSFAGCANPSALIAEKSASNVGNDGGNGCSRPNVWFILYKLGDDIPFDENVLLELLTESTRVMGVGGRAAISMFRSSLPDKPPYRVSQAQQEEIMRQVNELVEKGMVRPSSSPFCSLVLLVHKKDGTYRMCVNYRALNRITIKNRFHVPRIEDLFDKLQELTYFSRIDLKSGYHQIRIVDEDILKTAFCITFGLYEYLVMPFGLTNAQATFNHMMECIF